MPALSPYPYVGGTPTGQARGPAPTIISLPYLVITYHRRSDYEEQAWGGIILAVMELKHRRLFMNINSSMR